VYCRACFGSQSSAQVTREEFPRRDAPAQSFQPRTEDKGIGDLKRQVDSLNLKVDSMLKILQGMSRPPATAPVLAPKVVPAPIILPSAIVEKISERAVAKKNSAKENEAKKKAVVKKKK
jgi:hypothetical protein